MTSLCILEDQNSKRGLKFRVLAGHSGSCPYSQEFGRLGQENRLSPGVQDLPWQYSKNPSLQNLEKLSGRGSEVHVQNMQDCCKGTEKAEVGGQGKGKSFESNKFSSVRALHAAQGGSGAGAGAQSGSAGKCPGGPKWPWRSGLVASGSCGKCPGGPLWQCPGAVAPVASALVGPAAPVASALVGAVAPVASALVGAVAPVGVKQGSIG
ncbi:hypothetical protein AAY473_016335 [Plecturocebus cupreus]